MTVPRWTEPGGIHLLAGGGRGAGSGVRGPAVDSSHHSPTSGAPRAVGRDRGLAFPCAVLVFSPFHSFSRSPMRWTWCLESQSPMRGLPGPPC